MTIWLTRAAYGNTLPRGGYDVSDRFMVWETDHHTPGQNPTNINEALEECNQILGTHLGNNWGDIGYTWLVHGEYAIEGRGYGRTGAHAPGANSISIGIAFLLDGRFRQPTPTEWRTARAIMQRGATEGYVSPNYSVSGHRDWVATTCPGDQVYGHIHDPRDSDILVPPPTHVPGFTEEFMIPIPSHHRMWNGKHVYDLYDLPADQTEGGEAGVTSYVLVAAPDGHATVDVFWNSGTAVAEGLHVGSTARFKVASRGAGGSDVTSVVCDEELRVEGRVQKR